MTMTIRPAAASQVKPLVGLYSESGAGKTRSALLLAKGFTGDMSKVTMIETESGRGEAYANDAEVGGGFLDAGRPRRGHFFWAFFHRLLSKKMKGWKGLRVCGFPGSSVKEWSGAVNEKDRRDFWSWRSLI